MNNYDSIEEISEYLIPKGFKKYNPSQFDSHHVLCNFQKRYDDEIGKKYFIDAKVWDFSKEERLPENYIVEYNGQYYQRGTHNAVNFTFIDWTLDQVEAWIEKLFADGYLEHYEEW